jgi:hypothetical protein
VFLTVIFKGEGVNEEFTGKALEILLIGISDSPDFGEKGL